MSNWWPLTGLKSNYRYLSSNCASMHVHTHVWDFFITDMQPSGAFRGLEVLTEKESINQQAAVSEQAAAGSLGVRGRMF